jgi:regulator of sigma D
MEDFSNLITLAGKDNYVELLTSHLKSQCFSEVDYISKLGELYSVIMLSAQGRTVFIDS